jgi:hypothetical protein
MEEQNSNEENTDNIKEEEPEMLDDENENFEDSLLFCHDRFCTSIPEIYFDENSSLAYLFCNKNEKNEKHKYCLNIKNYLKNNILLNETKLKKVKINKNNSILYSFSNKYKYILKWMMILKKINVLGENY